MRFMLDTSICVDYLRGRIEVMEWVKSQGRAGCVVSMIAGHAVSLRLPVATRNPADFFKAPGVKVFSFS